MEGGRTVAARGEGPALACLPARGRRATRPSRVLVSFCQLNRLLFRQLKVRVGPRRHGPVRAREGGESAAGKGEGPSRAREGTRGPTRLHTCRPPPPTPCSSPSRSGDAPCAACLPPAPSSLTHPPPEADAAGDVEGQSGQLAGGGCQPDVGVGQRRLQQVHDDAGEVDIAHHLVVRHRGAGRREEGGTTGWACGRMRAVGHGQQQRGRRRAAFTPANRPAASPGHVPFRKPQDMRARVPPHSHPPTHHDVELAEQRQLHQRPHHLAVGLCRRAGRQGVVSAGAGLTRGTRLKSPQQYMHSRIMLEQHVYTRSKPQEALQPDTPAGPRHRRRCPATTLSAPTACVAQLLDGPDDREEHQAAAHNVHQVQDVTPAA